TKLKSVKNGENVTKAVTFAEGCGLQTISYRAFYHSAIDLIDLPLRLKTIGEDAFRYSELTSITIPNSVTLIGQQPKTLTTPVAGNSFRNCTSLTSVTFASGGSSTDKLYVQYGVFADCPLLSELTLCERMEYIANTTFYKTALVDVEIPASVTFIDYNAFAECPDLNEVTFAEGSLCAKFGVSSKNGVFTNSGLKKITIPAAIQTYSNLPSASFTGTQLNEVKFESGDRANFRITSSLFKDLTTLTKVKLPTDVVYIDTSAFANTRITEIKIPKKVTTFANTVFQNCTELVKVEFENDTDSGLVSWAGNSTTPSTDKARDNARNANVTIFQGCDKLKKVVLPNGIKYTGKNVFNGLGALEEVQLPDGLLEINEAVFYGSGIKSITIPGSVTYIGFNAFRDCARLKDRKVDAQGNESENGTLVKGITFEPGTDDLTTNNNPFYNSGLTSIEIPARMSKLGTYAFANCNSLASVTFEANSTLTGIGTSSFWGTSITTITLPDSITSIGNSAFRYSKLASINIPSSVTSIGVNPFANCSNLATLTVDDGNANFSAEGNILYNKDKTVLYAVALKAISGEFTLGDDVTEIKSMAFANSAITSLTIGDEVVIGDNAFLNSAITNLTIGNSVEIGLNAFSNCASLGIVNVGDEVAMDDQAFANSALTQITVGNDAVIGYQAFGNCDSLGTVTIGDNATLGSRVFENCDSLTAVSASSVAYIGLDLFKDCANNVTLSGADDADMTYKGYEYRYDEDGEYWALYINSDFGTTFKGDTTIQHVVISKDVTTIEADAFNGCSNLVSIVME
ncbi:MAG: leucine-rich repeat domain-containing protein, partial [Clostridiales bacterium]|nr:leucine-rich repeat domain-containing protein [Clostridiales bacterium]